MIKVIFRITLLCVFLLPTALEFQAQITITSSDMPQISGIYSRCNATVQQVSIDSTGANYYWNFKNLQFSSSDSDTVVTALQTPLVYNLAFTNIFDQTHFANHAIRSNQQVNPFLNLTDVYEFFKSTSSKYEMVGFGAKFNGIPLPTTYTPVEKIYNLPLNYQDDDSSNYAFGLAIPGIGYYGQSTIRTYEVDGWGTLELPDTTYNTVRVRVTKWMTDTIFMDTLGFGTSIPRPKETQLIWLSKNEGLPILQVTGSDGIAPFSVSSIRYKCIEIPLDSVPNGISTLPSNKNVKVFTSNGFVNIQDLNSKQLSFDHIEIYNELGQSVYNKKMDAVLRHQFRIDLSGQKNGIYFLSLRKGSESETHKFYYSQIK